MFGTTHYQTAHTLWMQIRHGTQAEGVARGLGSINRCLISAPATLVQKVQQQSHVVLNGVSVGEL